jgi:error-prone DNA polymerase
MGFYSPATIVDDAMRHGLLVLPVCVVNSAWECTLEEAPSSLRALGLRAPGDTGVRSFAVRMGLRYVKSLSEGESSRIVAARRERAFASVEDFVQRTDCDEGMRTRLAQAGAFASIEPGRRDALWQARGALAPAPLALDAADSPVAFRALTDLETVAWDYETTGHSPRGHPLGAMRARLVALGLPDARTVAALPNGRRVRYAGLVIVRQRPATAKGVVFMTMEDETGFVNVVLWKDVFDRHALLAKTTSFLGVTGRIQRESDVVHVVAESLWEPDALHAPARTHSRDFH